MQDVDALEEEVSRAYLPRIPVDPTYGEHVLILGHSSSGKSTAARAVAASRNLHYVYDVALLELPRFAYYTQKLFLEGDKSYYFPYETEAILARFLQNLKTSHRSLCDQGIESIWAYARVLALRGDLEPELYQSFYSLLLTLRAIAPWPRLAVRFRCDPTEAIERVRKRGRPHELLYFDRHFIAALDNQYACVLADFPEPVGRVLIDTTGLSKTEARERLEAALDAYPPSQK